MQPTSPTPIQASTTAPASTPTNNTSILLPKTPRTPAAPVLAQLSTVLKTPEVPVKNAPPSLPIDLQQAQGILAHIVLFSHNYLQMTCVI